MQHIQNIIVSACISEWLYILLFIPSLQSTMWLTLDSTALGVFCMKCFFLSTEILLSFLIVSSFVFFDSLFLTCLLSPNTEAHMSLNWNYWVGLKVRIPDFFHLYNFPKMALPHSLSLSVKWGRMCYHLFHLISINYVFETLLTTQTRLLQNRFLSY